MLCHHPLLGYHRRFRLSQLGLRMAKAVQKGTGKPADESNGYTVVARRYRPQQFADLIGQEHVAGALTNALETGRIAHAYLFTGARGVGKTSTARILAKALNCVKGPTSKPCDVCEHCLAIAAGEDVDVVEIDAASNTGVENIRELRQNVGFRPQNSKFKVYIIDEVHMLSNSAFNALLKTLEEPPPHVKFIFATTEVWKIPVTILSRCQRFDFSPIGPAKVFETLKHIAQKEGLQAGDDALKLIARRAGGSMRDAQTLLDQLLGSAQGHLTAEAVHSLLGTVGHDRVGALADALLAGDSSEALRQLGEAAERGLLVGELADQLIDFWRGMMLVAVAGPNVADLPAEEHLAERIRRQGPQIGIDAILAGLDLLTAARAKMARSPHAQVILEVALVRLARLNDLLPVAELVSRIAQGELGTPTGGNSPDAGSVKKKPPSGMISPAGVEVQPKPARGTPAASNAEPVPMTEANLSRLWPIVCGQLGPMLSQAVQSANSPAIIGPNALALSFSSDYTSAYDACSSETGAASIHAALRKITGQDWSVRIEKRSEVEGQANTPGNSARTPSTARRDLMQLPLFQRAAETLGAQLVRVEEGFDPQQPAVD